jgi:uncharacterized surface protein with fasciclin (FAS1) repeats
MKSFVTSLLTLSAIATAATLTVKVSGLAPSFHDSVAQAQTTTGGTQPAAGTVTPTPTPTGNIIQTMQASGQYTQALIAISAAGLTQTLQSGGPYTVFAPTDAAFAQVPQAQLQAVLSDTNQLKQVLSYHVAPGELSSAQLKNMSQVTSLQGAPIKITTNNGALMVDNATVVQPDVYATNGVIQGINQVLQLPAAGATPAPTPTATP